MEKRAEEMLARPEVWRAVEDVAGPLVDLGYLAEDETLGIIDRALGVD
jgi:hypothetical protein